MLERAGAAAAARYLLRYFKIYPQRDRPEATKLALKIYRPRVQYRKNDRPGSAQILKEIEHLRQIVSSDRAS